MLGTRTTKINKTWILPLRSKLIYIIYTLEWWSNRGKVRASVVIQMVKNPPAMQETCLQFLGWDDFPEEGIATHSSIFAWRIPMDRDAWQATVYGVAKSQTQLRDKAQHTKTSCHISSIYWNSGVYRGKVLGKAF